MNSKPNEIPSNNQIQEEIPEVINENTDANENHEDLENIELNLDSPRTKFAVRFLGFTLNDFIQIPYKDFLNNNPDIWRLPKEIQQKRYEFYEQYRMVKIQKVFEIRESIEPDQIPQLEEIDYETMDIKPKGKENCDNPLQEGNVGSTAINQEIKQFDRLKKKNELDLISSVTHELERQVMIKEAEQKLRKNNRKKEKFKMDVLAKRELERMEQDEREYRRRLKEEEKQRKLREENLLKYQKEQERAKLLEKKEKERLMENIKKHQELEQKRIEFQLKVEAMNEAYNRKIYEKLQKLEEKEHKRLEEKERKRQEEIQKNHEKRLRKQEVIERIKLNNDRIIEETKVKFMNKQELEAEKKRRLDEQRDNDLKARAALAKEREENSKKVLEKDKEIQQKKLDDYNEKQLRLMIKQAELQKENERKDQERKLRSKKRNLQIQSTKERNEELLEIKRLNTLNKLAEREKITEEVLRKKTIDNYNSIEENNQKYIIKQDHIKRLERMNEQKKRTTQKWIEDKSAKIDKFKQQQHYINEMKRRLKEEITYKRREYELQFAHIFHSQTIDQKMIMKIHDMFPDNEKINALLVRLDELEREKENDLKLKESEDLEMQKNLRKIQEQKKNFLTTDKSRSNSSSPNKFKNNTHKTKKNKNIEINTFNTNQKTALTTNITSPVKQGQGDSNIKIINTSEGKREFDNRENISPGKSSKETFETHGTNKIALTTNISNELENFSKNQTHLNLSKIDKKKSKKEIEIQHKLNLYKFSLSNQLLEVIKEEKKKEKERLDFYNNADNAHKPNIKNKIDEERTKSAQMILELNDQMAQMYKDYESSLRM